MNKIKLFIILIVSIGRADAKADSFTPSTVKELRDFCRPVTDSLDKKRISREEMNNGSYCLGLIQGVVESMLLFESANKTKMICLSGNETYGQFVKVFMKYSDNHPEEWHIPCSNGVMNAMYYYFKCTSDE